MRRGIAAGNGALDDVERVQVSLIETRRGFCKILLLNGREWCELWEGDGI